MPVGYFITTSTSSSGHTRTTKVPCCRKTESDGTAPCKCFVLEQNVLRRSWLLHISNGDLLNDLTVFKSALNILNLYPLWLPCPVLSGFSFSISLPNPPVPLDWIFSFTQPFCKLSSVSFLSRGLQMHRPFILPLAFSKLQTYLTCGPKTLQISVLFPQTTQILPNAENDITTTSCTQ